MASRDWFLLVRGGRLDRSNHRRFTVNAALRWPLPTSDRQDSVSSMKTNLGPGSLAFICNTTWQVLPGRF
jgi:hypothetical protein